MKKLKLTSIILGAINTVLCLLLLILLTPNSVPLISGIHDEIIVIGSKWWLVLGITLPLVFMTLSLCLKNRISKFIFTELIVFVAYNNMLAYSYFCTETTFILGELSKIPLALSLFLPASLAIFVYGSFIKTAPYKSKLGIISKYTTTTEFIWIQAHITSSYHFRLSGLIMFISSIVFIFIHFPLIELAILILCLIIPRLITIKDGKKMTLKYLDMKHKDEIHNKKDKSETK